MNDRRKIISGILIFLVLATFPFWYTKGKTATPPALSLDTPEIQKLAEKRCIEPTDYMRASHMELIVSWREAVVREGERLYIASDGRRFAMSLSQNCLRCHSDKERFCDSCHSYAGVKPTCWSCHVVPKEAAP